MRDHGVNGRLGPLPASESGKIEPAAEVGCGRATSGGRPPTHPLAEVVPVVEELLTGPAQDPRLVVDITDGTGTVLWRNGASMTLGTSRATATKASSALSQPVKGRSAEDVVHRLNDRSRVAAPVMDPETGGVLGVIDVNEPAGTLAPAQRRLVTAAAWLAEHRLRDRLRAADARLVHRYRAHLMNLRGPGALVSPTGRVIAAEPHGRWPERIDLAAPNGVPGHPNLVVEPLAGAFLLHSERLGRRGTPRHAVSLRLVSGATPSVLVDGRASLLTRRPAEILTILSQHPEGVTAERLAVLLDGDNANPSTVRGGIRRLRSVLGDEILVSLPYRLDAVVDLDIEQVRALLGVGRIADALRACRHQFLLESEVERVRALGRELEVGLRSAVRDCGDPGLLRAWSAHPWGRGDSLTWP
ncbi:helix-turn-helix domain-containing protein [Actinomycetospora sp. OC33-EN08]|uniref:Helix-turn-helix domain-containing protein n=1 Tax=Actinomycetospora aurantiaca TaxID=3129233 RepID=A0ABU8MT37_9PSEU